MVPMSLGPGEPRLRWSLDTQHLSSNFSLRPDSARAPGWLSSAGGLAEMKRAPGWRNW